MPRTGLLRDLVTIQGPPTETQDAVGQPALTWPTFATAWASIKGGGAGGEFELADRQTADATYKVEIRYLAGVNPRMRIVTADSRTLEIVSAVDEEGRRRRLVLTCKEEV